MEYGSFDMVLHIPPVQSQKLVNIMFTSFIWQVKGGERKENHENGYF